MLRLEGYRTHNLELSRQSMNCLAMGAPVLIPRLAFNLMSENMLFVSLRAMMRDFTVLTILAVWCFIGFLLSMFWLSNGSHGLITISKWMLWVWFGLDGTGIQRSVDFHEVLGPVLMVLFAFLGNTLFLTILVSMLSTTFSRIEGNAQAEIMFRRAVLTFEGVKSDAIFAYQPPFNLLALLILLPLKFMLTPRWFHKINVAAQRTLNAPILLGISLIERRALWSGHKRMKDVNASPLQKSQSRVGLWDFSRAWSVHGDINRVFESLPFDEEEEDSDLEGAIVSDIDDEPALELGQHSVHPKTPDKADDGNRFDKAFGRIDNGDDGEVSPKLTRVNTAKSRRDSVVPWVGKGGSAVGDMGILGEEVERRLEGLEEKMERIESLLIKLVEGSS